MPYIIQEYRNTVDTKIDELIKILEDGDVIYHPGKVTYIFYRIIVAMFRELPSYHTIALIRGILSGTADEFNRKIAHPYEDEKIKQNGDV